MSPTVDVNAEKVLSLGLKISPLGCDSLMMTFAGRNVGIVRIQTGAGPRDTGDSD